MRPDELMVGDIVRLRISHNAVRIESIFTSKHAEGYLCHHTFLHNGEKRYNYSLSMLEPVPLTEEILEKNAFKREEEERGFSEPYCVYVNNDFQYVIKVYPKEGMDRYSRLEIGEYDDNEYISLLINHVHELQHALRLAGVNKEITI